VQERAAASARPAEHRRAARRTHQDLVDQHGKPFRLADLLARRSFVVLAFYVKAFTGG